MSLTNVAIVSGNAPASSGNPIPVADASVVAAIIAAALTPPVQTRSQSLQVADRPSITVTSSANDTAIALDSGNSYAALVNVTAVSGTSPTLDLFLQESFDGGTTFTDIFQVYRIKATGTFVVPNQLLIGQRRWRWAVSGTSPSFTFSINGVRGTASAPLIRQFFDYTTINPNNTTTPGPTWYVAGVKTSNIFAFTNTTTTAAVLQLQVSEDGANFTGVGSTINPGNNNVGSANVTSIAPFVRIGVNTAGSGQTQNYVGFYGVG